ncbi:GntR family transcriptional regulator [Neptunicella sp.]|uniref:GntR family transcriptional regulator n=1 Tax=Neptunicella sp. TaxID=2125986 RepID=UPI003F6944E1
MKSVAIDFNRPTSPQIFNFLRDEIVAMKLLPGTKISENTLADRFSVSRTPVREVIAKLVNWGFVEVRPQRGTFVSKLSLTQIMEARFIREALEIAVVSHVAEHRTDELIEQCQNIIDQQQLAANEHDALKFQYLDDAFHQTLSDFTHFERAANLIQSEKAHMDRVRNLSLQELGGQYQRVLAQHNAILNAIKSADPEKSREAMRTHTREILAILSTVQNMHPDYFEEHSADRDITPQII